MKGSTQYASRGTHHASRLDKHTMPTSVIMPKYEMSQETGKIALG